jgi:RimJ/RimL family protein N-acetyltransferase
MSPERTPIIRRATPKDVPGRFFHPHPFDEQTIKQLLKSPSSDLYFVQLLDKKIIGYSMLRFFGYPTPSYGCCIRKGYEGKGYGTILTQWTMRTAKDLGYTRVILKVYNNNQRAINLYTRIGFTQYDTSSQTNELLMDIQF